MDHIEKYTGNKEKFYFFLKDEVIKLFKDKLKIDGALVRIPNHRKLDYRFKLSGDEHCGEFTIKVTWGEKSKQTEASEEKPKQTKASEEKPKQAKAFEEKPKQTIEFEEKLKQAEAFEEMSNIGSDGMDITTNVSFDYEPYEF